MPPKTRRTTSADVATDSTTNDTHHSEPDVKKQKLENADVIMTRSHDKDKVTNEDFDKEKSTIHTRSHDHDKTKDEHATTAHETNGHHGAEKETHIKSASHEEKEGSAKKEHGHKGRPTKSKDHDSTDDTAKKSTETESKGADSTAEEKTEILEKGKLIFYYRPKLETEEVSSAGDIQRFTFVMSPDDKETHRHLVVGNKGFPEKGPRARGFCFVSKVSKNIEDFADLHKAYDYETKTVGTRHQEAARVAGEALYQLVQHGPNHVHLVYVLVIPDEPSETQTTLHIHKEGSMLLSVRNPTAGPSSATGARGLPKREKAHYPEKLMEHFKGKIKSSLRFAPLHPDFLDHEGCELLMISNSDKHHAELEEVMNELENEAEEIENSIDKETHHHPEDAIYEEAHLDKKEVPDATTELV